MSYDHDERSPLFMRTKACLVAFDRLIDHIRDNDGILQYGVSDSQIQDFLGQFRIWAGNIGAVLSFETKSSLDYRVRNVSKIETQIAILLDDLCESLDDVLSIVRNTKENRIGYLASVPSEPHHLGCEEQEEISEIRETLDSCSDSIKHLFRYSILIRNNSRRDRYSKSAVAAICAEFKFSEQFDISHVRHKFPALQIKQCEWLIHRLGRAITRRRQYLRYCREHHDKTSKQDTKSSRGNSDQKEVSLTLVPLIRPSRSEFSRQNTTLASTEATTLVLTGHETIDKEFEEDSQSMTSFATSTDEDIGGDMLQVINLEEVSKGSEYFECPYIQACKTQKVWRKHVLSDLKPYICLFEECELKIFSNQHDWFSHELREHRKQWKCHFCSHQIFNSSILYAQHAKSMHSKHFPNDQLPALLEISQRSQTEFSPAACLFCNDWEQSLRRINPDVAPTTVIVVTPKQLQQHIGAHMEQLALFAIPRGYTDDGEPMPADTITHQGSDAREFGVKDSLRDDSWQSHCKGIIHKISLSAHAWPFMKPSVFPAISLPVCGSHQETVVIPPLDIGQILERLQTQTYSSKSEFRNDIHLMILVYKAAHPRGSQAYNDCRQVENLVQTIYNDSTGPENNTLDVVEDLERELRWRTSKVHKFLDEVPVDEGLRLRIKMLDGEIVRRRFRENDRLEDVYAFIEVYDWIKSGFPSGNYDEEPDHSHEYDFKLRYPHVDGKGFTQIMLHDDNAEPSTLLLGHNPQIGAYFFSFDQVHVTPLEEHDLPQNFFGSIEEPPQSSPRDQEDLGSGVPNDASEGFELSNKSRRFVFDPTVVREWKDNSGCFQIRAQYFGFRDKRVLVYRPNGVIIAIPATFLSKTDLDFVEANHAAVETTIEQAVAFGTKPVRVVVNSEFKARRIQELSIPQGGEVIILDGPDQYGCCLVALTSTGDAGLVPATLVLPGVEDPAPSDLLAVSHQEEEMAIDHASQSESITSLLRPVGTSQIRDSNFLAKDLDNLVSETLKMILRCDNFLSAYDPIYQSEVSRLHQSLVSIRRAVDSGLLLRHSGYGALYPILTKCKKALEKLRKGITFYQRTGTDKEYQGLVPEAWQQIEEASRDIKSVIVSLDRLL